VRDPRKVAKKIQDAREVKGIHHLRGKEARPWGRARQLQKVVYRCYQEQILDDQRQRNP